jgi:hypothetical protein
MRSWPGRIMKPNRSSAIWSARSEVEAAGSWSLDKENQVTAKKKVREWQKRIREHLKENPQLRRDYHREKIFEVA